MIFTSSVISVTGVIDTFCEIRRLLLKNVLLFIKFKEIVKIYKYWLSHCILLRVGIVIG